MAYALQTFSVGQVLTAAQMNQIEANIVEALGVLGTAQATTSGTTKDFTSIPSWAKEIDLQLDGVSLNGTSSLIAQIGDAGGIEATGYNGVGMSAGYSSISGPTSFTSAVITSAAAIFQVAGSAARIAYGTIRFRLLDAATFTWTIDGCVGVTETNVAFVSFGGVSKSLSAALDRIRLGSQNGTDTFDAGKINIIYR